MNRPKTRTTDKGTCQLCGDIVTVGSKKATVKEHECPRSLKFVPGDCRSASQLPFELSTLLHRRISLDRLWKVHEKDRMPYIEILGDYWCSTADLASKWADDLIHVVRLCLSDDGPGAFFHGTSACLSA